MCVCVCENTYFNTLFALFCRFRQILMDTLCLHNNTSSYGSDSQMSHKPRFPYAKDRGFGNSSFGVLLG